MEHLRRWAPWLLLCAVLGWWVTPIESQGPQTIQAVAASGTILQRLGIISGGSQALGMYIIGSTTLQTTASVSVDSVTVVNVVSVTALSPLPTTASVSVDSATVYQGSPNWSFTALTPLSVVGNFAVNSATVFYGGGVFSTSSTGPQSVVFSGVQSTSAVGTGVMVFATTQNVLAYPTGVYSTTTAGVQSIIFSGTQNVLAYPTGIYSTTQVNPYSVIFSGTPMADSTANPTAPAIASFGMLWTGSVWHRAPGNTNGAQVIGAIPHDNAGATTVAPVLVGGRASATIPATVSADGDAVTQFFDRSGAAAVRISDGTSLITALNPCTIKRPTSAPINVNASGLSRLITAVSGAYTFLCSMFVYSAGTVNVAVVEGSDAGCNTNTTGIIGGATAASGPNLLAQTGWTLGNGAAFVAASAYTNYHTCVITSATVQLSGVVTYVQQP